MNLGQLTTFSAYFASDPQQTRYSGNYTQFINQAQEQFALDTRVLYKDVTFQIVANQAAYTLPSDFMWERMVQFTDSSGRQSKLTPTTRSELYSLTLGRDWNLETGTPLRYVVEPQQALKQLLLFPNPQAQDAVATNGLSLQYYYFPPDMVNSTDIPLDGSTLLAQFHIGIAALTAYLLLMGENVVPEVQSKQGILWKLYQDKVTEAIDKFGDTRSSSIRLRGGRYW